MVARYGRNAENARFADVLLPPRWPRFERAKADKLYANAIVARGAGDVWGAIRCLEAALRHDPAHLPARLSLARGWTAVGRHAAALDTMRSGSVYHRNHPKFLEELLLVLRAQHRDDEIVSVANGVLSDPASTVVARSLAKVAARVACYERNYFDRLGPTTDSTLGDRRASQLLEARISWQQGFHELAIVQLRTSFASDPADEASQLLLASWLGQCDRPDEARRALLELCLARPGSIAGRIALIRAYRTANAPLQAEATLGETLVTFAADRGALMALADDAVLRADDALCRRIRDVARASAFATEPFDLMIAEAQIRRGDARAAIATLQGADANWDEAERQQFAPLADGLRGCALIATGEHQLGRAVLSAAESHVAPTIAVAIAELLLARGNPQTAREILGRAARSAPLEDSLALTRLIETELVLNRLEELPANITRFASMRRPSPHVLRVAQHKLGSDQLLFSSDRDPALQTVNESLARLERRYTSN